MLNKNILNIMEIEQRSEDWFNQRAGRFTASRISELLGVKGFGLTGEGYIFEKAIEIAVGRDEDETFESFDMRRGNELEPLAFDMFRERKQLDFIDVEKASFFPYKDYAGASPDGLVGENEILEIKCPRPKKFFNLVANGIEAIDKNYIDQMQMQMLCTNSVGCYFFNYIIYNGKPMGHEIYVPRDDQRIEFIEKRMIEALDLRDYYVRSISENLETNGL
jgi:putative phage-type endonuclease